MTRSALSASGLLGNEKILPPCSRTNSRAVPGARVRWSGLWNFSFGNAGTTRYGCGGSGLPVTFDVVHGTRGTAAGPAAVGRPADSPARPQAATERTIKRGTSRRFMRPTRTGGGRPNGEELYPNAAMIAPRIEAWKGLRVGLRYRMCVADRPIKRRRSSVGRATDF